MPKAVFLFDVDGVLLDPLAYKAGLSAAIELLVCKTGLSNPCSFTPSPDEIAHMESCGIHDVWDMCNLVFGQIIRDIHNKLLLEGRLEPLPGQDSTSCLTRISQNRLLLEKPDYKGFADGLDLAATSIHPPDRALELLKKQLLPSQAKESYCRLLQDFLANTRSVKLSYGTRLFQNIILGKDLFQSTYGLESNYDGEGLLQSLDRVLLSREMAKKVLELQDTGIISAAIYTARPGLAPADGSNQTGYAPEAEIAACAAGLERLPVIGMGMMEWLASEKQKRSADLTKPNTTHAFTALLSALHNRNDSALINSAYDLDQMNEVELRDAPKISLIKESETEIYLFEDTISGIKPVLAVESRLKSAGYKIEARPLGIAVQEDKRISLLKYCSLVFPEINEALSYAIDRITRRCKN